MSFDVICEIEPPTRPDIRHVRHQIGVLAPVAHAFLVPDNHIGRATVSSIAVAHEVAAMGGRSIACLNSRDRNLLGFQRDMLTAAAYGVGEFLFVHGDKPTVGGRTGELTVRTMIEQARAMGERPGFAPPRIGVAAALRPLPAWKRAADFVFAQMSFDVDALLRWRDAAGIDRPVYAGVLVLASADMARRLAATIPDIDIPAGLVARVEADRRAGVEAACAQVAALRDSGAFDGVHLVTVSRYREVALLLEHLLN
ncbi:methylenetetrahydrofolate reductase [Dactylosporangium sp. AC04546]|uniref:methylenetetrahydrofolate reductase n=1 Tax=Dactylosporangium sp. AC04546 TaxID=2862460 RepID=UPI001EDF4BD8|nr:methylenetetrahydrofolate reductase [Dactylosporangium sp. AC04546]WVK80267.1 methylenetetrahydrofolate reductase [Dactylosporangium sp. AC04546]